VSRKAKPQRLKQNVRLDGLPYDAMFQGHAIQKLHHHKCPFVLLTNIVNRADIWMVEGRGGLSFAPEACEMDGIPRSSWA
jgi:hypothetical protein